MAWRLCLSLCDRNAAEAKDATPMSCDRSVLTEHEFGVQPARACRRPCDHLLFRTRPDAGRTGPHDGFAACRGWRTRKACVPARTCERRAPGLPRAERCHRPRMIWEVMPTLQTRQDQGLVRCLHGPSAWRGRAEHSSPTAPPAGGRGPHRKRGVRPPAAGLSRSQQCGFGGRGPPPCWPTRWVTCSVRRQAVCTSRSGPEALTDTAGDRETSVSLEPN